MPPCRRHDAAAGAAGESHAGPGAHLEAARDAAISEIDATHYPLLASLAAPQADSAARGVLAAAAHRHGFATVDLREVFCRAIGSPLPGRRLFLDYCHLTAEGMHLAMAAVAHTLLRQAGAPAAERGWPELAAGLPPPWSGAPPSTAAAAEATALLGAAVHTAHRHLPVTARGDLLDDLCGRALDRDAAGAAAAMLDLADVRTAPGPAVLSAAQGRNLARPAPLLLQHGWRWPHLDGALLAAMERALRRRGRPEAAELAALVVGRRGLSAHRLRDEAGGDGLELVHPPFHLAAPVARSLPAAMAAEGMAPGATLRALLPSTSFDLVLATPVAGGRLHLELSARLPEAAGEGEVTVALDGRPVGRVALGRGWRRAQLTVELPVGRRT